MSDLSRLQSDLGTRYTLDRELGGGGMSRVFLATETGLTRSVVIKLLSPDLAASVSADRFTREVRLAAALQHANIVPLLSAGEAGGLPYFTMPFVRGETLRARIQRGAVPIAEAISILRDMARALAYAHGEGVVHRDIKPENVLLSGGAALIADFGIAKAVHAARTQDIAGSGTLTQMGTTLGTPAYMAPEQAAGDPDADGRTDIYAWGVVAWELLAGMHPFAGKTSVHAWIAAQLTEMPGSITAKRPDVPSALAVLVMRCLEKDPAKRPSSATELLAELDAASTTGATAATLRREGRTATITRVAVVAGLLMAIAGGVVLWRSRAVPAGPVRLAVLPFDNLGDSTDVYFADGLTDAVRGKLTGMSGLEIVGSASSGQYRHATKSPQEIGKELGVRYLLIAKVRWDKRGDGTSRVQVSPELVDAGSASNKWAQSFDAPITDVFKVQGDIAGKVAEALQVALTPDDQQRLAVRPTTNVLAYDAYLRGAALSKQSTVTATVLRAIAAYREAVTRDPNFALAWSELSRTYAIYYFNTAAPDAVADSADAASRRALELAPNLPAAHAARSTYFNSVRFDFPGALAEAERALASGPNPALLVAASKAEQNLGRWDAARAHAEQAARLDPRDGATFGQLTRIALWQRRSADAITAARSQLALDPESISGLGYLVMAHMQLGDTLAAHAALHAMPPTVNQDEMVASLADYWDLGWTFDHELEARLFATRPEAFNGDTMLRAFIITQQHTIRGDTAQARELSAMAVHALEKLVASEPTNHQLRLFLGLLYVNLGRPSEGISEGEQAVAEAGRNPSAFYGPYYEHILARVYTLADQPDKAIDMLQKIQNESYFITKAWLRVDPNFQSLRGNPRFQKLIAAP